MPTPATVTLRALLALAAPAAFIMPAWGQAPGPHRPRLAAHTVPTAAARHTRDGRQAAPHAARREKRGEHDGEAEITGAIRAYWRQRLFPHQTIDWATYAEALRHRDSMPPAVIHVAAEGDSRAGAHWNVLGPHNLTPRSRYASGPGAVSGRINAAAYDPAHPGTFYAGAAGGGVWKTTDGGTTWTPLSDSWPFLQVSSIAVDPTNSNNLYVGTGDFVGNGLFGMFGFGVQKSTDGGQTWSTVAQAETDGGEISKVIVDPDNPQLVMLTSAGTPVSFDGSQPANPGQIWRSTDGGQTWSAPLNVFAYWTDIVYSAKDANGNRAYYATAYLQPDYTHPAGVVYKSLDRGLTWSRLTLAVSSQYPQVGIDIACSVNTPGTVYLLAGGDSIIYKSTNGGASWQNITGNFPTSAGNSVNNWAQSWYDYYIACSTRKDTHGTVHDVVYVGEMDPAQSINDGGTWRSIGGPVYSNTSTTHTDQHCFVVNPNDPNDALVGNDGGIYEYTYNPTADTSTWKSLNAGLVVTQLYAADYSPTNVKYLLSGAQDNSSPGAAGGTANWSVDAVADGMTCDINPKNVQDQYASSEYGGVFHTTNGWSSFTNISPSTYPEYVVWSAPLVMDRRNPNIVYAATDHLWQYNATTNKWTGDLGGKQLAGYNQAVQTVAIAPSDSNRIYTGSTDGQLWMTTDAGNTWTRIDTGVTRLPTFTITAIAVDPTHASRILVGLSGFNTGAAHVWRCNNTMAGASRTWQDVSGTGASALPDSPVNAIALDVDAPATTWYVGTDIGAFMTANSGSVWTNATQPLGLPTVPVTALTSLPGTGMLNAATFGRGIWGLKIAQILKSVALNPTSVTGGASSTGTVTLTGPAPAAGAIVALKSANPAVATVPASVTIPAGATSATFTVTTVAVTASTTVQITAKYHTLSRHATLTVN